MNFVCENCKCTKATMLDTTFELFVCEQCRHVHIVAKGKFFDLEEVLFKLKLQDDGVTGAISGDRVGRLDSIPRAMLKTEVQVRELLGQLETKVLEQLSQVQNRLHYVRTKLAELALVSPQAGELVDVVKQVIDLVSAAPDGPVGKPEA
jgi:hypothetical protein